VSHSGETYPGTSARKGRNASQRRKVEQKGKKPPIQIAGDNRRWALTAILHNVAVRRCQMHSTDNGSGRAQKRLRVSIRPRS
jgi:hypothetical protein